MVRRGLLEADGAAEDLADRVEEVDLLVPLGQFDRAACSTSAAAATPCGRPCGDQQSASASSGCGRRSHGPATTRRRRRRRPWRRRHAHRHHRCQRSLAAAAASEGAVRGGASRCAASPPPARRLARATGGAAPGRRVNARSSRVASGGHRERARAATSQCLGAGSAARRCPCGRRHGSTRSIRRRMRKSPRPSSRSSQSPRRAGACWRRCRSRRPRPWTSSTIADAVETDASRARACRVVADCRAGSRSPAPR